VKRDGAVTWPPVGPNAKPTKIEAATLTYHEAASEIWLKPWGRLTRQNTVVEGNDAVLHLDNRKIRKAEANHAHGADNYPNRKLQYSADLLLVDFDDDGRVQKIMGQTNAQLVSTSDASETTVTASCAEMNFEPQGEQSVLTQVAAVGNGVITSKPLPAPGRQLGETHIL